jgi:hypothetical protein
MIRAITTLASLLLASTTAVSAGDNAEVPKDLQTVWCAPRTRATANVEADCLRFGPHSIAVSGERCSLVHFKRSQRGVYAVRYQCADHRTYALQLKKHRDYLLACEHIDGRWDAWARHRRGNEWAAVFD